MEKVFKTPIYTRKAQKAYFDRNKDNEEWTQNKKQISKNWYNKNKEKLAEKYLENKEKVAEKYLENKANNTIPSKNKEHLQEHITCECGCIITRASLSRHKKTKKHQFVLDFPNN
tara:strand:- start:492 stop:836 length:345 start_codon:yes stop_codon:yes gene_type:complete